MIHGIHGQNDVEKGRDEMDVLLQGSIVQLSFVQVPPLNSMGWIGFMVSHWVNATPSMWNKCCISKDILRSWLAVGLGLLMLALSRISS